MSKRYYSNYEENSIVHKEIVLALLVDIWLIVKKSELQWHFMEKISRISKVPVSPGMVGSSTQQRSQYRYELRESPSSSWATGLENIPGSGPTWPWWGRWWTTGEGSSTLAIEFDARCCVSCNRRTNSEVKEWIKEWMNEWKNERMNESIL